MTKNTAKWSKFHKFQEKPGWCGPAVIQMALLSVGIKKKQKDIAREVHKDWWGTTQQIMLAYFSRFFKIVNYKHNATFKDVSLHLKMGHIVILNWWDDIDEEDTGGGHYSVAVDYDHKLRALTLADPSTTRPGIWTIADPEFNKKWFDTLDMHDRTWIDGWMLWIDPASKITE
jgi:ABC-type bacteriocin/lantibiotic exporter with double-glycine peptidase domain